MKKYEHPHGGNAHHRGGLYEHSIWTARFIEHMWNNKDTWIYKYIIKFIHPTFKNFTILAGFLHDVGKLDGKMDVKNFIKPTHDKFGYNLLMNKKHPIHDILLKCFTKDSISNYPKVVAFLSLVSLHHLAIGKIMTKKITEDEYINELVNSLINFPEDIYTFRNKDLMDFFLILTLVQLCDVLGARPIGKSDAYSWDLLKKNTGLKENLPEHLKPWNKYKYDMYGPGLISSLKEKYTNKLQEITNQKQTSISSTLPIKEMIVYGQHKLKYSIVKKGVFFYKSMNRKITKNDFKNYKDVSWFGSAETAEIYFNKHGFGGFKYQFQTVEDIKLLRFDDPETINSLYKIMNELFNLTNDNKYVKLANMLQFATGVGVKKEDIQKLKIQFKNEKAVFSFDINQSNLKRNSYADIDKVITKEILCMLGHDLRGYIAKPASNSFHEEIALCEPWIYMKFVALYKVFDFEKKTVKNV